MQTSGATGNKIEFKHTEVSITKVEGKKNVNVETTLTGIIRSVNMIGEIVQRLVEHHNTPTSPKAKEPKELPQPLTKSTDYTELKDHIIQLQQAVTDLKKQPLSSSKEIVEVPKAAQNLTQTSRSNNFLIERKVAYAGVSYLIATNLNAILPTVVQGFFQRTEAQIIAAIVFYGLITKAAEKILAHVSFDAIAQFARDSYNFLANSLISLINFINKVIIQPTLSFSSSLVSWGYYIIKLLIQIAIAPAIVALALPWIKPEWDTTGMIFNTTNEFIAHNQLDAILKTLIASPYAPLAIGILASLVILGTLNNGYHKYVNPKN